MTHSVLLDKKTRINLMFDFYGCLLTFKQQQFIKYYFYEDFSLAEIAENFQISRQAVNEHLKRSEQLLNEYENKLHLVSNHLTRTQILIQINEILKESNNDISNKLQNLFVRLIEIEE